jgi:anti-sigma regulatory factor (Ser/Thr protein kinase)/anti-anti-sigma regulatory factor
MSYLIADVRPDPAADLSVVELSGTLDQTTASTLRSAMARCLAQCPLAAVIDLSRVEVTEPDALSALAAAIVQRRNLPDVAVVICGAPDRIDPSVVVPARLVPDLDAALTLAADTRDAHNRRTATLARSPDAPAQARVAVAEACAAWGLTEVEPQARLIASELVTNAVEHAGSASELELGQRGQFLHIRVTDASPAIPRMRPPESVSSETLRGRGLMFVDVYSSGWGWTPVGAGKVVWATIRTQPVELDVARTR